MSAQREACPADPLERAPDLGLEDHDDRDEDTGD